MAHVKVFEYQSNWTSPIFGYSHEGVPLPREGEYIIYREERYRVKMIRHHPLSCEVHIYVENFGKV